jgi:solute carrier family 25 citrate transporter 1
MLAGLCAGVVEAVVAVTPSETIKCISSGPDDASLHSVRTKLIQDASSPSPMYTSSLNGTIAICRTEGFGGVYRGLVPTVRTKSEM